MMDGNKKIFSLDKISFRKYLSIISVIFVFSMLFFAGVIYYSLSSGLLLKKIDKVEQSNIMQLNNKITACFDEMARLTINLSNSGLILQDIMDINANSNSIYSYMEMQKKLAVHIMEMQISFDDIEFIGILTNNYFYTSDNKKLNLGKLIHNDANIFKTIESSAENLILIDSSNLNVLSNREFFDLYCSMFKKNFESVAFASVIDKDKDKPGIIFIVMKPQWISSLVAQDQNLMITNSLSDTVLYTTNAAYKEVLRDFDGFKKNDSGFLLKKIQNIDYRVFYVNSKYWNAFVFRNLKDINKQVDSIKFSIIITLLISIAVIFFMTGILSRYIVKPINKLVNTSKNFSITGNIQYNSTKVRSITFRDSILFYFISISIVAIIFFNIVLYYYSSKLINESLINSITVAFNQTIENIDNFVLINERISKNILVNKLVQDFLVKGVDNYDADSTLNALRKVMDENISLSHAIFNVNLYKSDGKFLFSTWTNSISADIDAELLSYLDKYGRPVWTFSNKDKYGRDCVNLVRKIKGVQDNEYNYKDIGYLVLTYYERDIQDLYSDINLGEESEVFIVDKNGMIISCKSKSMIGSYIELSRDHWKEDVFIDGYNKDGRYLNIHFACKNLPLYVIGKVSYNEFARDVNQVLVWNIYILISGILIASILSYIIAFKVTKPVDKLRSQLMATNECNAAVDVDIKTTINEIDELGNTYNKMIHQIRDLIKKIYVSEIKEKKLEKEKKEAELIALQAQIDPHFLYNTLESIKWMVKNEQKCKAVGMISSLGDLFRLGISRENNLISIKEEVDYARSYIEIMKNRIEDKIVFNFKINEDILNCMTLKLTLQPIIENAIMHGMKNKPGKGIISIIGYSEEDRIIFKVVDNGLGIKKDILDEILTSLRNELPDKSVGIFNIQKRIQLYFGEEYGLFIESMPGIGTIVKLVIPKVVV